jgi:hypothetical protein
VTAYVIALVGLGTLVLVARLASLSPRNDLVWAIDHRVQARVTLDEGRVQVEDLRDFAHAAPDVFEERYRDETYDVFDVQRVWFVLAPFAERWRGLAHSFVSFELTGDRFLAVSVEARRERDEGYSLRRGIMRGFEVTYVVGTERDLIGLRALRGDTLYLYPSRATPEQARRMFVDMLESAERVRRRPEFYHTLANSCASTLRRHVNRVIDDPLPWGWAVVFPGYSDELALEHGLLDVDPPIAAARQRFRVDPVAREAIGSEDFGARIRAALPRTLSDGSRARGSRVGVLDVNQRRGGAPDR